MNERSAPARQKPRSLFGLHAESGELLHLDSLRFFAAVTVVIYHFRNQYTFGTRPGETLALFDHWQLAVSVFFVISGIVISFVYQKNFDFKKFMASRFARLAPLHYVTLFAFLAMWAISNATGIQWSEARRIDWNCLVPHLTFTQSLGFCQSNAFNHVSWSISAEMIAYLAFPLLMIGFRSRPMAMILLAIALPILATTLIPADPEPWYSRTYNGGAIRALIDFTLGMAIFHIRGFLGRIPYPRLAFAAVGCLLIVGLLWPAIPEVGMLVLCYLLVLTGYAADLQTNKLSWFTRIAPLAALTYGIYMVHPLVRTIFFPILKAMGLSDNSSITICFFLVFLASYVSLKIVENPMRRIIRKNLNVRPKTDLTI